MESDLISRSAVHAVINSQIFDTEYPSELDELEKLIDELPAIDAVPVVRCKECKHYDAGFWCAKLKRGTAEDYFCAYGARMDEEETK